MIELIDRRSCDKRAIERGRDNRRSDTGRMSMLGEEGGRKKKRKGWDDERRKTFEARQSGSTVMAERSVEVYLQ